MRGSRSACEAHPDDVMIAKCIATWACLCALYFPPPRCSESGGNGGSAGAIQISTRFYTQANVDAAVASATSIGNGRVALVRTAAGQACQATGKKIMYMTVTDTSGAKAATMLYWFVCDPPPQGSGNGIVTLAAPFLCC